MFVDQEIHAATGVSSCARMKPRPSQPWALNQRSCQFHRSDGEFGGRSGRHRRSNLPAESNVICSDETIRTPAADTIRGSTFDRAASDSDGIRALFETSALLCRNGGRTVRVGGAARQPENGISISYYCTLSVSFLPASSQRKHLRHRSGPWWRGTSHPARGDVFLGEAQKASASARVGWTRAILPRTRLIMHRDDVDSSGSNGLSRLRRQAALVAR